MVGRVYMMFEEEDRMYYMYAYRRWKRFICMRGSLSITVTVTITGYHGFQTANLQGHAQSYAT